MSATATGKPTAAPAAQPLWFIHNLAYVHADGEQTGGAFDLVEVWGAHGDMPPLHIHHREDETFYVLEGELTLFAGAEHEIVIAAGQAAVAPRGVAHAYRVDSDHARWLAVSSPSGFAEFVRAVSEPAPAAEMPPAERPVDPGAIAAAGAEFGIEILAPPGTLPRDLEG
jgi:quercetin dioxygenase-like cupin family protein